MLPVLAALCPRVCSEKIRQDFSNYSAWHYRTVLIPRMHPVPSREYWRCIDDEFALVRAAFYTEPADQSAWLYHRWLLARVLASGPALPSLLIALGHPEQLRASKDTSEGGEETAAMHGGPSAVDVFARELLMCRELNEMEADCKWTLLTMALLIAGQEAVRRQQVAVTDSTPYPPDVVAEVAALFTRLVHLDPMRTQYYCDVQASVTAQTYIAETQLAYASFASGAWAVSIVLPFSALRFGRPASRVLPSRRLCRLRGLGA